MTKLPARPCWGHPQSEKENSDFFQNFWNLSVNPGEFMQSLIVLRCVLFIIDGLSAYLKYEEINTKKVGLKILFLHIYILQSFTNSQNQYSFSWVSTMFRVVWHTQKSCFSAHSFRLINIFSKKNFHFGVHLNNASSPNISPIGQYSGAENAITDAHTHVHINKHIQHPQPEYNCDASSQTKTIIT